MGPRRYVALNPADALKQIRTELGPEAVVLSNREVAEGVEIVAIRPEDLASMSGERSMVAPNLDGAPFAALPMPSARLPSGGSGGPLVASQSGGSQSSSAAPTKSRISRSEGQSGARGRSAIPVVEATALSSRSRAPGASVMARQRRIEEGQPQSRPLGSGINHELIIANVSQRSDRDRRRNPVYPPDSETRGRAKAAAGDSGRDGVQDGSRRTSVGQAQQPALPASPKLAPPSEHDDSRHHDDHLRHDDPAEHHDHQHDNHEDQHDDGHPVQAPGDDYRQERGQGRNKRAEYSNDPGQSELARDLAEVKRLLQTHVAHTVAAAMSADSPVRAELLKQMFAAGFSAGMASEMVAQMPEQADIHSAVRWMQERLKADLRTLDVVSTIDEGGVYAFIGPTGVGKTTMVAKLAARCVLRFGRSQVALLTTDTYRIGAQEQLKVFAKILGLTITSVRDGADLAHKLEELSRKHVVLLDTAGMGQRDQLMIEQLSLLAEGRQHLKRVLVVSATTGLHTLDDVYETYRQALGQEPFWGVVLTKLDEAVSLAPMVECVIRHQLPVLFMANGQRVPEDLHVPNTGYLVHRSLRVKASIAGSTPLDDHIPTLIADNLDAWARKKA
ncbi:MAG: flagellar biosynthesis protein FlhF [Betaproteobacteria bacterium]|nr:flagellar biosynthesis protein FlhF [Betaproteobacteria bacterium]